MERLSSTLLPDLTGLNLVPSCIHIDDTCIAIAMEDGRVFILDADGHVTATLKAQDEPMRAIAMSAHHGLVIGSDNGTLQAWNIREGVRTLSLSSHSSGVIKMQPVPIAKMPGNTFDTQGDFILSGSCTGSVILSDLRSERTILRLNGHKTRISCLAVLGNGDVVSAAHDRTVRVWSLVAGECLHTLSTDSFISAMQPVNSSEIVLGYNDSHPYLWKLDRDATVLMPPSSRDGDWVNGLTMISRPVDGSLGSDNACEQTGRYLVASHASGTLRCWFYDEGHLTHVRNVRAFTHTVRKVLFWQGKVIVAGNDEGGLQDVCGLDSRVLALDPRQLLGDGEPMRNSSQDKQHVFNDSSERHNNPNIDDALQIGSPSVAVWGLGQIQQRLVVVLFSRGQPAVDIWAAKEYD